MTTKTVSTITFPYKRSLGPVMSRFFSELTAQRIVGIRAGERVIVPPLEYDPETGRQLDLDFVEVGPAGTVESYTWVAEPGEHHPLDRPFAYVLVKLDGASVPLIHVLDCAEDALSVGLRVAPRWAASPVGGINDIVCFVPGETPEGSSVPEPQDIQTIDFLSKVTYTDVLSPKMERYAANLRAGKLVGQRCPQCDRVFLGRGYCSVDAIMLDETHEVALPDTGVVTNFTIITPTPYPGQKETEPFGRASVVLSDGSVVVNQQIVLGIPVTELRVGLQVAAQWAPEAERSGAEITSKGWGTVAGFITGWKPTGEPDLPEADYMERVF